MAVVGNADDLLRPRLGSALGRDDRFKLVVQGPAKLGKQVEVVVELVAQVDEDGRLEGVLALHAIAKQDQSLFPQGFEKRVGFRCRRHRLASPTAVDVFFHPLPVWIT